MFRAFLHQVALIWGAACTMAAHAMPPAPTGSMEAGVPAFVVMGPEALGLSTAPTDLHVLPDGRVLVVSQSELAFGDGVRWETFRGVQDQENLLTRSVVERARRQIGLFTTVLLLVSAVIVALIIYTLTTDKMREIATLKLIGAPDRSIVALIMQQSLMLGGIAFAGGTALLLAVKDAFPRRVLLGPEEVAGFGLLVLVICLAASLLGVRYALRIEPAQALGG